MDTEFFDNFIIPTEHLKPDLIYEVRLDGKNWIQARFNQLHPGSDNPESYWTGPGAAFLADATPAHPARMPPFDVGDEVNMIAADALDRWHGGAAWGQPFEELVSEEAFRSAQKLIGKYLHIDADRFWEISPLRFRIWNALGSEAWKRFRKWKEAAMDDQGLEQEAYLKWVAEGGEDRAYYIACIEAEPESEEAA